MQTISQTNNLAAIFIILLLLSTGAAEAKCLSLGPDGSSYKLCKVDNHVYGKTKHTKIYIGNKLNLLLDRSNNIFSVRGNIYGSMAALYISTPSRPEANGAGYCGSGTEDYIILIRRDNGHINLVNSILVQSCLKNISFAYSGPGSSINALSPAPLPTIATFKVINPEGNIEKRKISVIGCKLKLTTISATTNKP